MTDATRRDMGRLALGALLLGGAQKDVKASASASGPAPEVSKAFPKGFIWGAATSAFQIEGALEADGRGPSIWDSFARLAGKVAGGANGDTASDSYRRFREDIALMKGLGLSAYRFSISWPRIFPTGTGAPNMKGLDHYRRLVDGLLEAGIAPFCTLYHWDLPRALEDRGGWLNRDIAQRFADYAVFITARIPGIQKFITLNETVSFIEGGYGNGLNPPGKALGVRAVALGSHHAMLAHGTAVRAMRAAATRPIEIGSAEVASVFIPMTNGTTDIDAARRATIAENAAYVTVVQTGSYPEAYLQALGKDAPKIVEGDYGIISTPTDFQGLNIYYGQTVRAADTPAGYAVVPRPVAYPRMGAKWATIDPEALYWGPKLFAEAFAIRKIYITENGVAASDTVAPDGQVYDTDRVMFLRAYLTQLQRATYEGVPVAGYFHWSLLDNFEWLEGYEKRFGLHHVDFVTQKRTPKLSAAVYRDIIARNGL